jgi:hypothetical protein
VLDERESQLDRLVGRLTGGEFLKLLFRCLEVASHGCVDGVPHQRFKSEVHLHPPSSAFCPLVARCLWVRREDDNISADRTVSEEAFDRDTY